MAHFGVSYKMVHSLSEIWSAAATPPLWLSSQLTVGKEHPLVRPAQPKDKAPPLAAHSKWHRPISKMTHYRNFAHLLLQAGIVLAAHSEDYLFIPIKTPQGGGNRRGSHRQAETVKDPPKKQ